MNVVKELVNEALDAPRQGRYPARRKRPPQVTEEQFRASLSAAAQADWEQDCKDAALEGWLSDRGRHREAEEVYQRRLARAVSRGDLRPEVVARPAPKPAAPKPAAELYRWAPGYPQSVTLKRTDMKELNQCRSGVWTCVRADRRTYAYKVDGSALTPCDEAFALALWRYARAFRFRWAEALAEARRWQQTR